MMTPDPYQSTSGGSGDPDNPQSWNRYAYTIGDPVNWYDPDGEFYQPPQQPPNQPLPPFVNSNPTSGPSPSQQAKSQNKPPNGVLTGGMVYSNAGQVALQWLKNPSCQKLFGTGLGNPENVLQSLLNTGSFDGLITLNTSYIPITSSTTLGGFTLPTPVGMLGAVTGTGAVITINQNIPIVPTGSAEATNAINDVAETLIEELAHAYNYTMGSGGSTIVNDNPVLNLWTILFNPSQNPSTVNYETIMQDCNK